MDVKKFHVKLTWMVPATQSYAPIYAESGEQAEVIAIARMKDLRKDFDQMQNIEAKATECQRQ